MKKRIVNFWLLFCYLFIIGCNISLKKDDQSKEKYFLAHNIWWDNQINDINLDLSSPLTPIVHRYSAGLSDKRGGEIKISSINYQTGILIRMGTMIDKVEIKPDEIKFRLFYRDITVFFQVVKKYEPELTGEELYNRLITTKTKEEIAEGLSPRSKEAILSGIIVNGMSKKQVLMAFGYPPSHFTPDTSSNVWYYWQNRFIKFPVEFDNEGKVK